MRSRIQVGVGSFKDSQGGGGARQGFEDRALEHTTSTGAGHLEISPEGPALAIVTTGG